MNTPRHGSADPLRDSKGSGPETGRSRSRASLPWVIGISAAVVALGWGCLVLRERFFGGEPWMRGVKSPDLKDRMAAVRELERAGRMNRDAAIPALLQAVRDPDAEIRAAAAKAMVSTMLPLGGVTPPREQVNAATSAALACLGDPDPRVRAEAVQAAWMVVMVSGAPPQRADLEPILPHLLERLGDEDASVRLAAIQGVGFVGPRVAAEPPAQLLARLEDVAEPNRHAAANALATYKDGLAGSLPSMVASLEKRSPEYRKSLLRLLEQVHGTQLTPKAIPGLVAAMRTSDPEVVYLAVNRLSELLENAGPTVPEQRTERRKKLDEFLETGPAGSKPPDRSDRDKPVVIGEGPGRIGRGATALEDAAAALAKALRPDRPPALRVAAARALGRLRPHPAIFAALREHILDRDPDVRHAVIWAIHDLDFAEGYAVPQALATALEDASAQTRSDAAAAIGHSGMGVDPFVPALVHHALNDPDERVRAMCQIVIRVIDPPKFSAASVPHLIKGLDSSEPMTREVVCEALAKLGRDSAPAIPILIRLVKEPYDRQTGGYQGAAASALGRIAPGTPQADEAVATLMDFLRSDKPSWETTLSTLYALERFGTKAGAAVPRLRELQHHKEELVRKAATKALPKIQPAK